MDALYNLGIDGNHRYRGHLLAVAETEEIVVAQGKLEPVAGVREIQIPVNGVVQTLDVEEGDRVKAGQVY